MNCKTKKENCTTKMSHMYNQCVQGCSESQSKGSYIKEDYIKGNNIKEDYIKGNIKTNCTQTANSYGNESPECPLGVVPSCW